MARSRRLSAAAASHGSSRQRKGQRKRGKRQRKGQAQLLEKGAFEDDGVLWKVLKVELDDDLDSIVVFYYDIEAAKAEVVGESELHEDHEYVEHSSMAELLGWIKKSG